MNYEIREAKESDVIRLDELVNSAYRGESSKKGWTTEADILGGQRIDVDRLREVIRDPSQKILCLLSDKFGDDKASGGKVAGDQKIIATVNLQKFHDQKGTGCYLGMLTVEPTLQTGGVGKILMAEAETFARKWGAERMTLSVIQVRTELMAWYERRGYRKTGETGAFPYGDIRFGEPKRDDLHFVMFEKSLTL